MGWILFLGATASLISILIYWIRTRVIAVEAQYLYDRMVNRPKHRHWTLNELHSLCEGSPISRTQKAMDYLVERQMVKRGLNPSTDWTLDDWLYFIP